MSEDTGDPSEDPSRSIDQDLPEAKQPATPPPLGPATAGPAVALGAPPTGESILSGDMPSEAEIALEREVKETRATPRR